MSSSIPSGYILGRLSSGQGDVELIPTEDLSNELIKRKGMFHLVAFSWPHGVCTNSLRIGDYSFPIGVTFPPDFTEYRSLASQASASANATGSTAFKIQKNGSDVGTATFGAGGVTCTFSSSAAAVVFAKGDKLTILGPATADATLANPNFTLVGYIS